MSLRDCDDGDDCTVDSCDESADACVHEPRDDDGDGYASELCGGDDCDDTDADVSPGATEICEGSRDENCDGVVDEGCCEGAMPCPTSCGSTGTTRCDPDGTLHCDPPTEVCNGADDDCDGTPDDGFTCVRGRSEACTSSCGSTGSRTCDDTCGWGTCAPPAETCNGVDDDCDGTRDNGFACRAGSSSSCPTACGSTGTRACLGDCTFDLCAPPAETCNGVDDDCDGTCDDGFTCCQGTTRPCNALGFYAGTATCRSSCASWNTSSCTNCGNGAIDSGEVCDGTQLGGASCTSIGMGFGSGTLHCAAGCVYDTSSCSRCGNGTVDSGEDCDGSALGGASCTTVPGGFVGGTLRCNASCHYDTSMCTAFDPTGMYTVTPAPTYMCAFVFGGYLVSFNGGTMSFSLAGTTMTLTTTGLPCSPRGAFNPSTRAFSLTCTAPGTCAETYALTGSFTTSNTWTGTFTASYAGSCLDCTSQSWSVTGMR